MRSAVLAAALSPLTRGEAIVVLPNALVRLDIYSGANITLATMSGATTAAVAYNPCNASEVLVGHAVTTRYTLRVLAINQTAVTTGAMPAALAIWSVTNSGVRLTSSAMAARSLGTGDCAQVVAAGEEPGKGHMLITAAKGAGHDNKTYYPSATGVYFTKVATHPFVAEIVTAGSDGQVLLWSGDPLINVRATASGVSHQMFINAVAFNQPYPAEFATAADDKLALWNFASRGPVSTSTPTPVPLSPPPPPPVAPPTQGSSHTGTNTVAVAVPVAVGGAAAVGVGAYLLLGGKAFARLMGTLSRKQKLDALQSQLDELKGRAATNVGNPTGSEVEEEATEQDEGGQSNSIDGVEEEAPTELYTAE